MNSSAIFSDDFVPLYRYQLRREWADGPLACFVMLNPSTADASKDDPTIRRCISFAKREGCGRLVVVNLFAYRATVPVDLFDAMHAGIDPIGELNDRHLTAGLADADLRIAAWGAAGIIRALNRRSLRIIEQAGYPMKCLGLTKGGFPRHPLYVRGDAPLIDFPVSV